jgi:hypothetical protein
MAKKNAVVLGGDGESVHVAPPSVDTMTTEDVARPTEPPYPMAQQTFWLGQDIWSR